MKLYKTIGGIILQHENAFFMLNHQWDNLINRDDLYGYLNTVFRKARSIPAEEAEKLIAHSVLAPVGRQEVWAAGVTYLRSRDARMDEAKDSGGADLYDRVYEAERPELFFKSLPHRVAGPNQEVYIRRDSTWNVPEPELTLFINTAGNIQAYTVGNDVSSRSIEGDNPLYLPQAKAYERSAALGPCLFVTDEKIAGDSLIEMTIYRNAKLMYRDSAKISRMKRSLTELAGFLYLETDFNDGCFLMTGTCLVPPNDFTLEENDIVNIAIDHIGTLTNTVSYKPVRL